MRDWTDLQATIRKLLQEANSSPEMVQAVCARMKDAWEAHQRKFDIPIRLPIPCNASAADREALLSAVKKTMGELESQLHDYTSHVLFERLKLEIELYVARHPT